MLKIKLDEIIKAIKKADNKMLDLDNLSDEELKNLENQFKKFNQKEKGKRSKRS